MMRFIKSPKVWAPSAAGAALLATVGAALALRDPAPSPPRDMVLVARNAAFWLPESPELANPPIVLSRGQPVRLTLRNDEPSQVLHCFTIGGLGVKSTRNLEGGQSETLSFTPSQRGSFAYACLMHPSMAGRVEVR